MNKWITILGLLIFLTGSSGFTQEMDVNDILDSTRSKLQNIEAYKVDASFYIDIDFVNMPVKKASIHFTSPDKLEVESDGFLMIPKLGMKPMINQLDVDKYHAVLMGEEQLENNDCFVVKMIPTGRKNKIVLSTLWIRMDDFQIVKWESFTKKAGNIVIDLSYDIHTLPSQLVFSFELSGMNIPLKYFGNEVEIDKAGLKSADNQKGKVTVVFENYQIKYK